MKRLFILPILLLTFLIGEPAFSADFMKGEAAYAKGNYAVALRQWEPLAEQGIAPAQYYLGEMYFRGQGVSKNFKTAVKWLQLAAEQGYAEAQSKLKIILVNNLVVGCLYDEIDKVKNAETKMIVENYCRNKLNKKSLEWLLKNAN